MATPTKTLHPLPFEHLEPHRFEDLVRQLAYDFRNWRTLEATGRSGGDEGYDVRGWEIVPEYSDPDDVHEDDPGEGLSASPDNDREWLFQCKREKAIGPKKLGEHLDQIGDETLGKLYGLVYACACNISKTSRDLFRARCREAGISECYIWSLGELEDMLFHPKNDGLLFAYFGISMKIRQRSVKTAVRTRLATKRKLVRAFPNDGFRPMLLRDPEDERYPYLEEGVERADHRWWVRSFVEHHPLGIVVEWARYPAYLAEDGINWDMADVFNESGITLDSWLDRDEGAEIRTKITDFCREQIDERCRGYLTVEALLRFDDVIEVDPDGDTMFEHPHVFVSFKYGRPPLVEGDVQLTVPSIYAEDEHGTAREVAPLRRVYLDGPDENRVEIFPPEFRKLTSDRG